MTSATLPQSTDASVRAESQLGDPFRDGWAHGVLGAGRWRLLAVVASMVFLPGAVPLAGAGGTTLGTPVTSSPVDRADPITPYGLLLDLLEIFHQWMTRLPYPETTPTTAEGWFALIEAQYAANGVPPDLIPCEQMALRTMILQIVATMEAVPSLLAPQAAAHFIDVLRQIYVDLGGNPGDVNTPGEK